MPMITLESLFGSNEGFLDEWWGDNEAQASRESEDACIHLDDDKFDACYQEEMKSWTTWALKEGSRFERMFSEYEDEIHVARVMALPDYDAFMSRFKNGELMPGYTGIGQSWSWDDAIYTDALDGYDKKVAMGWTPIQLRGTVDKEDVDWKETLMSNTRINWGDDEREIFVRSGRPVHIHESETLDDLEREEFFDPPVTMPV